MDFVYVLSGSCSGISSMLQILSGLPETEIHSLTHQLPVSAHTLAVTIKSVSDSACLKIEEANSLCHKVIQQLFCRDKAAHCKEI